MKTNELHICLRGNFLAIFLGVILIAPTVSAAVVNLTTSSSSGVVAILDPTVVTVNEIPYGSFTLAESSDVLLSFYVESRIGAGAIYFYSGFNLANPLFAPLSDDIRDNNTFGIEVFSFSGGVADIYLNNVGPGVTNFAFASGAVDTAMVIRNGVVNVVPTQIPEPSILCYSSAIGLLALVRRRLYNVHLA
jgi:hypothetical protein